MVEYETIDITEKIKDIEDEPEPEPEPEPETEPEPLPEPKPFTRKKSAAPTPEGYKDDPNHWNLVFLKNARNGLLNLTDKYVLPDYNITPENLEIMKNYRQMLREFININKEAILSGVIVGLPPRPI